MIFRECELCGATLDPGERCTCREDAEREKRKADAERRAELMHAMLATVPTCRGKRKRP